MVTNRSHRFLLKTVVLTDCINQLGHVLGIASTLLSTGLPEVLQVVLATLQFVSFRASGALKVLRSLCCMLFLLFQSVQPTLVLVESLLRLGHIGLACVKLRKTLCMTPTIRLLESAVFFCDTIL